MHKPINDLLIPRTAGAIALHPMHKVVTIFSIYTQVKGSLETDGQFYLC